MYGYIAAELLDELKTEVLALCTFCVGMKLLERQRSLMTGQMISWRFIGVLERAVSVAFGLFVQSWGRLR